MLEQVSWQDVVMGRKVPTEVTVTVADKYCLMTSSISCDVRHPCNNGVVTSYYIVLLSATVVVPSVGSVTFICYRSHIHSIISRVPTPTGNPGNYVITLSRSGKALKLRNV